MTDKSSCSKCESTKDVLVSEGLCTWCADDEIKGRNDEPTECSCDPCGSRECDCYGKICDYCERKKENE